MTVEELIDKYSKWEIDNGFIAKYLTSPNVKKTVWDLRAGDDCVVIRNGMPMPSVWQYSPEQVRLREIGDVFLGVAEAVDDLERRRVETLLLKYGGSRTIDSENGGRALCAGAYDDIDTYQEFVKCQGTICFKDEAAAMLAVAEIGEDRVYEALFGD